jgi:hypothetical protein
MKMHLAAIGYNERELELYVSQLKSQGFESIGAVTKAEDGSFYLPMAKLSKFEMPVAPEAAVQPLQVVPA